MKADTMDAISVKGYKSFKDIIVPLRKINILIGSNGAEKSNFLSLFELLGNAYEGFLARSVAQSGGADKLLYKGRKETERICIEVNEGRWQFQTMDQFSIVNMNHKSNTHMKRLLLLLAAFLPLWLPAQNPTPDQNHEDGEIYTYALIRGFDKGLFSNKIVIQIDFGGDRNFWGNDGRDILIDENGKEIVFNSMVDALNFMGSHGWKLEHAYTIPSGETPVLHWIVSKKIKSGEDPRGDLLQKRDKKKKKTNSDSE